MRVHEIDCDMGVDCSCMDWPTWEEFVAGNLETRAMSDARGPEAVEEDAWQTNVMVRISSDEGSQLDLEPMPLEYEEPWSPYALYAWETKEERQKRLTSKPT